jgi:uncharacterized protein (TIGR02996 family)
MSVPPAHRRLVPRKPRPPRADTEDHEDELDVTERRSPLDPDVLALDEPDPLGSLTEITTEQVEHDLSDFEVTDQRQLPLPPPKESLAAFASEHLAHATFQPVAQPAPEPSPAVSLSDLEPTTLHVPSGSGLEDRPTAHLSPAEYGLLAAIAEGHEPSRKLYADWLERRGEPARAEFLRLDSALHEMRADDPRFTRTYLRLREVAQKISVDWRSRVSRASIEACAPFGATCPAYWRALPADADDVRTCRTCNEKVYYCVTLQLAQERVQHGQRVALDMTAERWPNDLDRQCESCSGQVPPQNRFCPHCGTAMPRARSLGA